MIERTVERVDRRPFIEPMSEYILGLHEIATNAECGNAGAAEMHSVGTARRHVRDDLKTFKAAVDSCRDSGGDIFTHFRERAFGDILKQLELQFVVPNYALQYTLDL